MTIQMHNSPFHEGEKTIQERIGKADKMEEIGRRIIRPYMPDQHREFFEKLPFMVVGSVDSEGRPWASILPGNPGFMRSPTPTELEVNAKPLTGDPLGSNIDVGRPLGMLGIEIPTRRRNRLNVRVKSINETGFNVKVDQSFGNCPQYIQTRDFSKASRYGDSSAVSFSALDEECVKAISTADTFFVASYVQSDDNPEVEGVDVSHRGGRPGFVAVNGNTLTIPDYAGNNAFNTLGNFVVNPKAGLLFPNFETGELIFLSGSVEIIWEDDPVIKTFKGAERGWRFVLEKGIRIENALPFRANLIDYSPNSMMTGDWQQAKRLQQAEQLRNKWLTFRVVKVVDETPKIRSFYLQREDKGELLPFHAGQYLTIRISDKRSKTESGSAITNPMIRTYTVSSAPTDPYYRISVKKEESGQISKLLHQQIAEGARIEAKSPEGAFWIDTAARRPAILLAGGVGITPMISMALHTQYEGVRMRYTRPMEIFHSVKSTGQLAFHSSFRQLEVASGKTIAYHPIVGKRISKSILLQGVSTRLKKDPEYIQSSDYYLCGPESFMQAMYDLLIDLGVPDEHIFAEAFGPASLRRNAVKPSLEKFEEAELATVEFRQSNVSQQWSKGGGTLLELAEFTGLSPAHSCRSGNCGSCAVTLREGKVTYRSLPTAEITNEQVLICCAVPAKGTEKIVLEI